MSSFITTSFSSSKRDNSHHKYDISSIIISLVTFCALSTFCGFIFAVNFTGWFFVTVIGGTISKCRQEFLKSLTGKKSPLDTMLLDHRSNPSHRHLHLSSSKDGLPIIPSYRSSPKSNKNKLDSFLPFDFSFIDLTDGKSNKNQKCPQVLAPSEHSLKRNEKRTKNVKVRHAPDIPSQLGPNRPKEWKSVVDYYPSERHSHQPKSKSKLSVTDKMIESTAAYRVGQKCNGWINGDTEEYTIKRQQDSTADCTSLTSNDDPFHSDEPIVRDLNVRLDQERPKITRQERRSYNQSPASSLQYARQYLTILLTVKKEMNL